MVGREPTSRTYSLFLPSSNVVDPPTVFRLLQTWGRDGRFSTPSYVFSKEARPHDSGSRDATLPSMIGRVPTLRTYSFFFRSSNVFDLPTVFRLLQTCARDSQFSTPSYVFSKEARPHDSGSRHANHAPHDSGSRHANHATGNRVMRALYRTPTLCLRYILRAY